MADACRNAPRPVLCKPIFENMPDYTSIPVTHPALKSNNKLGWLETQRYRLQMGFIMFAADLLGFTLAGAILFLVNLWLDLFRFQWSDLRYIVIVPLCLILYFTTKLYPGVGFSPPEEIKLIFWYTVIGFLLGVFFFGFDREHWNPKYLALLPFGFLSTICMLAARWLLRMLSIRYDLWGAPVVVVGSGSEANDLARYFLQRRRLGFLPRYVITGGKGDAQITASLPVLHFQDLLDCPEDRFSSQRIYTALVDLSRSIDILYSPQAFTRLAQLFPRLILIANVNNMQSASFHTHDFEGIVGVEASRQTLTFMDAFIKRTMDIALALLAILLTFPFWAAAMLIIRLKSSGPIFFTQLRVGQNRRALEHKDRLDGHVRMIKVYKFRTMVVDAEKKLGEYLAANPQARAEWQATQKLKNDPRVIPACEWMRKFSVDELPQLINVLKGEMSLVGPRPMMREQISDYGDAIEAYVSTRPGMTGLWQVSGRNNTTFADRAKFDEYYVHNWSVWLDIYIMLRTVWVVISRDGAY